MSPAPASPGDTPRFDPRSEKFLESLRNLLEFRVVRQQFDENRIEIHHVYSRSMIEALEHATAQLEGGGWYVESITRIWDGTFFENLPGSNVLKDSTESDFWDIVHQGGLEEVDGESPEFD